jgi:hypothetical protein
MDEPMWVNAFQVLTGRGGVMDSEQESFSGEETDQEPAQGETERPSGAMDTPAEAMQDSESDFEESVQEGSRPMGSGARTPASPPNS